MQESQVRFLGREDPLKKGEAATPVFLGFPCGSAGKKIHPQWGRSRFDPWVGKIPWRRERLPTPVFWPGEFRGPYSPRGRKDSDTTEQLSFSLSAVRNRRHVKGVVIKMWNDKFTGIKMYTSNKKLNDSSHLVWFSHWVTSDSCYPVSCSPQASLSIGFPSQDYWSV